MFCQIRNQERRIEEVIPFSEVAKFMSNALHPATPANFGRASSSAYSLPSTSYLQKLLEEQEVTYEDTRSPGVHAALSGTNSQ